MWALRPFHSIAHDARHALRGLWRSPAFTLVAVASLALGIGANTAIFSFVNAILLKQLPVPEPKRLVTFGQQYRGKLSGVVWSLRTVDELSMQAPAFSGVFGWFPAQISLSTGDTSHWVNGEVVTGQYFRTLEVRPAIGRLLNEDDVRDAAANPVCVLSYGVWQSEFGGDPRVVGRDVLLNGHAYRVIGVTARGFYGAGLQRRFDITVPATRIADFIPGAETLKTISWLAPMARLKAGVSRTEAQQQTQAVWRQLDLRKQADLFLEDGSQGFNSERWQFGQPLLVLMGVVALVLVVACANLANLLLARAQRRAREFAVRISLGASRASIVRQLLVEALLLAAGGGVAGIALSFWIDDTLVAFLNTGRSAGSSLNVTPDGSVLAFAILLTFVTAILFGLAPAWQAARPDLAVRLKQESATSGPASRVLLRRSLVVVQIALSLVIVFGAGLLTRTLRFLSTADLGFQPERVIAINVDPAANGHSAGEASMIFDEILDRARHLPGVQTASLATSTPNSSMVFSTAIEVPGYVPKPVRGDDVVNFNFISSHYFETLGQHLLRGRDFDERDSRNSPKVAIVNEKFVQHYYGGRDPIGGRFREGKDDVEIVAVVRDTRDAGVRNGPRETVYIPQKQGPPAGLTLLVRARSDQQAIVPSLLGISIDRRMPVASVHTLDVGVAAGLSSERILGYLSTLFAALATGLAGIGLYGVLAYSITRRTREIGIRFAVGAQRGDVARLFARESLAMMVAGLVVGLPMALAAGNTLKSLLFGVDATDAATLFISVLVLALAVLLATLIPLWRAARVDPIKALRWE